MMSLFFRQILEKAFFLDNKRNYVQGVKYIYRMPTSLTTLTYLRLNNRRKEIDLCIRWPLKRVALT